MVHEHFGIQIYFIHLKKILYSYPNAPINERKQIHLTAEHTRNHTFAKGTGGVWTDWCQVCFQWRQKTEHQKA